MFFSNQQLVMGAKISSWDQFNQLGEEILKKDSYSKKVRSLEESFKKKSSILIKNKLLEGKTEDLTDKVVEHLNVLKQKLYSPVADVYLDFLSFQDEIHTHIQFHLTGDLDNRLHR